MRHNRSKKSKTAARVTEGRVVVVDELTAPKSAVRVGRRDHRPSSFGVSLLLGMQRKPVWSGFVDRGTVAARRSANKAARRARRAAARVGR